MAGFWISGNRFRFRLKTAILEVTDFVLAWFYDFVSVSIYAGEFASFY